MLVVEVALSVSLVITAALLARSLSLLLSAETGVQSAHVLSVTNMPRPSGYRAFEAASYSPELVARLSALPGGRSVGYARLFPGLFDDTLVRQPVTFVGASDSSALAVMDVAWPAFFSTVAIPLLRGRTFAWSANARSMSVAIVNERLAMALSPTSDVLGRHIRFGNDRNRQDMAIVGVVGNATMGNLHSQPPIIYRPPLQEGGVGYYPTIEIATTESPGGLAERIRATIAAMGREYVHDLSPLDERLTRSASSERIMATVASWIGVVAALLALVGVYSLLAYAVARRTREIGIRVAIGASSGDLLAWSCAKASS